MKTELFDYELPEELIAARPAEARDGARLLVVGPPHEDRAVRDLPDLLPPRSLVVVNDTRVIPARLFGTKPSGGAVELLLVRKLGGDGARERWRALGRSSKPLRPGSTIVLGSVLSAVVVDKEHGTVVVDLEASTGTVREAVEREGRVPLPPYMARGDDAADRVRYQTVFARNDGAVAAPTAGLHLSEELLATLSLRGHDRVAVTLHVGLGTFKPVTVDDLDRHDMHEEVFEVGEAAVAAILRAKREGRAVVAVGTTVVRALESAAAGGELVPTSGETRLLIQPGYAFRVVDRLFTNFHLPRSTLLALVSAFAGRTRVLDAYEHAKASRYRFYSYGDAMLLARSSEACEAGAPA